jgi:hypothetical protein
MGNKKRLRKETNAQPKKKSLTPEQIEAMKRIIEATKATGIERFKMKLFYYLYKNRVREIAWMRYGVTLRDYSGYFRKLCYEEYAFGKVFKDFGGFHTMMLTKCDEWDTDWGNFIDEKGNVIWG